MKVTNLYPTDYSSYPPQGGVSFLRHLAKRNTVTVSHIVDETTTSGYRLAIIVAPFVPEGCITGASAGTSGAAEPQPGLTGFSSRSMEPLPSPASPKQAHEVRWGFESLPLECVSAAMSPTEKAAPARRLLPIEGARRFTRRTRAGVGSVSMNDLATRMRTAWLCVLILFCSGGAAMSSEGAWQQHMDAGDAAESRQQHADAEKAFSAAVKQAEAFGQNDARLAKSLSRLASVYEETKRYPAAETLYKRALAIHEKGGTEPSAVVLSLGNLGNCYTHEGKFAEAEQVLKRALALEEKQKEPFLVPTLNGLSDLYFAQKRFSEAADYYVQVVKILEKIAGPNDPYLALSLNKLALIYQAQHKYDDAESIYKRVLAIPEHSPMPHIAYTKRNYAQLLRECKRNDEAAKLEAR